MSRDNHKNKKPATPFSYPSYTDERGTTQNFTAHGPVSGLAISGRQGVSINGVPLEPTIVRSSPHSHHHSIPEDNSAHIRASRQAYFSQQRESAEQNPSTSSTEHAYNTSASRYHDIDSSSARATTEREPSMTYEYRSPSGHSRQKITIGGESKNIVVSAGNAYLHTSSAQADRASKSKEAKADINTRDKDGNTPLIKAIKDDKIEKALELISRGADVNIPSLQGHTALHWAVNKRFTEIVQCLVSAGAKVDTTNLTGYTALHWAANKGFTEIVQFLISHGADVNAQDERGCTPLFDAAYRGNTLTVQALVNGQANVNIKTKDNWTAFHWAAGTGNQEIAKILLAHNANINAADDKGTTPLHEAASKGQISMVKFLTERGSIVNIYNNKGETPLDIAVNKGELDIEKILKQAIKGVEQEASSAYEYSSPAVNVLQKGDGYHEASSSAQDEDDDVAQAIDESRSDINIYGIPPLSLAVHQGNKEEVQDLVNNKGAKVNATSVEGYTALHWAALGGHLGIARFLLIAGAAINARDNEGCTPLHEAAKCGRISVVKLLTERGAIVDIKNNKEETALDIAVNKGEFEIEKLLLEAIVDIEQDASSAYEYSSSAHTARAAPAQSEREHREDMFASTASTPHRDATSVYEYRSASGSVSQTIIMRNGAGFKNCVISDGDAVVYNTSTSQSTRGVNLILTKENAVVGGNTPFWSKVTVKGYSVRFENDNTKVDHIENPTDHDIVLLLAPHQSLNLCDHQYSNDTSEELVLTIPAYSQDVALVAQDGHTEDTTYLC